MCGLALNVQPQSSHALFLLASFCLSRCLSAIAPTLVLTLGLIFPYLTSTYAYWWQWIASLKPAG